MLQVDDSDPDLFIVSAVTVCKSDLNDIWQIVLYAIKGVLLVFGVFLAWQARKVSIPALNDSKFIGLGLVAPVCDACFHARGQKF